MTATLFEVQTAAEPPAAREFAVAKRSVVIGGRKTSVSLEDAFWDSLKEIALRRGLNLSEQIATIDTTRHTGNLSSAIRLFVLDHFRTRALATVLIGERQSVLAGASARHQGVARAGFEIEGVSTIG